MYSYLEMEDKSFEDIYLNFCGMEECKPSYSYGPAIRDNYLIHYCLSGNGRFHVNNQIYRINPGDVFLITPGQVTFYQADESDPWTYAWFGFDGGKASHYLKNCNLSADSPVASIGEIDTVREIIIDMLAHFKLSYSNEMYIQGKLFLYLSCIAKKTNVANVHENENENIYVQKTIEYIQNNYQNDVSIQEIADYIGLNRSYLSTIFKEHLNQSPQEFLKKYRLKQAEEYLINTDLPINYIASSCGYSSHIPFSKAFTQVYKLGPRDYRKLHGLKKNEFKTSFADN